MNQDLAHRVLEAAPAEAIPPAEKPPRPRETAFAEHLRLLDNAVALTRERLERQNARLHELRAQVGRLQESFETLRERAETAEFAAPLPAPSPIKEVPAVPVFLVRRRPLTALVPYAVLAAVAAALTPRGTIRPPEPLVAVASAAPAVAARTSAQAAEIRALVRAYRPEGSPRAFADIVGPRQSAEAEAWETQRVGDGIYLVSFQPGGQPAYEFTVDMNARSVSPELDTAERLYSSAGVARR